MRVTKLASSTIEPRKTARGLSRCYSMAIFVSSFLPQPRPVRPIRTGRARRSNPFWGVNSAAKLGLTALLLSILFPLTSNTCDWKVQSVRFSTQWNGFFTSKNLIGSRPSCVSGRWQVRPRGLSAGVGRLRIEDIQLERMDQESNYKNGEGVA